MPCRTDDRLDHRAKPSNLPATRSLHPLSARRPTHSLRSVSGTQPSVRYVRALRKPARRRPVQPPGYPIRHARTSPKLHRGSVRAVAPSETASVVIDRDRWLLTRPGRRAGTRALPVGGGSGAVGSLAQRSPHRRLDLRRRRGPRHLRTRAVRRGLRPEEIRHALRVTTRATNGYVCGVARGGINRGSATDGTRLRLKESS